MNVHTTIRGACAPAVSNSALCTSPAAGNLRRQRGCGVQAGPPNFGGGGQSGNFNNSGNFSNSGLYIPGQRPAQQNEGPGGSRLIIPGREASGRQGGNLVGVEQGPPTTNPFRPPPNFMGASEDTDETDVPDTGEMLRQLRDSAGLWHKLASYLPHLARAGYDTVAIEADTGVERLRQNIWTVAAQVHQSVLRSGECSNEIMEYYDIDGTDVLLYELRFLSAKERPAAAAYIVENQLEGTAAKTLARAMKEQWYRQGAQLGFSDHPGDCLAFKHYRDAIETRRDKDRRACVKQALQVAVTDGARKVIEALGTQVPREELAVRTPALHVIRLTGDQTAFRAVPIVAQLSEATPAAIASVPYARQQGDFNTFVIGADMAGMAWMVLPAWHSLMVCRRPVGLSIPDCSQVPAIMEAGNASTDEEKAKLAGPGVLVVDATDKEAKDNNSTYVVAVSDSAVGLVRGGELPSPNIAVCGRVLFCCRPPANEQAAMLGVDGTSMMQL